MEYEYVRVSYVNVNEEMNRRAKQGWRIHTFDRQDLIVDILFQIDDRRRYYRD